MKTPVRASFVFLLLMFTFSVGLVACGLDSALNPPIKPTIAASQYPTGKELLAGDQDIPWDSYVRIEYRHYPAWLSPEESAAYPTRVFVYPLDDSKEFAVPFEESSVPLSFRLTNIRTRTLDIRTLQALSIVEEGSNASNANKRFTVTANTPMKLLTNVADAGTNYLITYVVP